MNRNGSPDSFDSDDGVLPSKDAYFASLAELSSDSDGKVTAGDEFVKKELEEKELEHSSLQETLDMELKKLDKKLQQKEVTFCCVYLYYPPCSHITPLDKEASTLFQSKKFGGCVRFRINCFTERKVIRMYDALILLRFRFEFRHSCLNSKQIH